MRLRIKKCSIRFLYAFDEPHQLMQWLQENAILKGWCLCGRSNVGKSSLINAMYKRGTAKTSKAPGRTQKVLVFSFFIENEGSSLGPFYLFDLPGYGTARVSRAMRSQWDRLMGAFFDSLPSGVVAVCLRDARHPEMEIDRKFEEFAPDVVVENALFVFNKVDKVRTQKERAALERVQRGLVYGNRKIFTSTKTKEGLAALEEALINCWMAL